MTAQQPDFSPATPTSRNRGCLFWALALAVVVGGGGYPRLPLRDRLDRHCLHRGGDPALSPAELGALDGRLASFAHAVRNKTRVEPIVLTGEELTALVVRIPEFRRFGGRARFSIDEGEIGASSRSRSSGWAIRTGGRLAARSAERPQLGVGHAAEISLYRIHRAAPALGPAGLGPDGVGLGRVPCRRVDAVGHVCDRNLRPWPARKQALEQPPGDRAVKAAHSAPFTLSRTFQAARRVGIRAPLEP